MFAFISETLLLLRLIILGQTTNTRQDRLYFAELTCYPPIQKWKGMLWFGWLITRKGDSSNLPTSYIKHLLIHLDQANGLGGWWNFYWTYLKELFRVKFYCPLNALEIEAYENQGNPYYVGGDWLKYRGRRKRKERLL